MKANSRFLLELKEFIQQPLPNEITNKRFRSSHKEVFYLNMDISPQYRLQDKILSCLLVNNIEVGYNYRQQKIASNLIELIHNLNPLQMTCIWCVVDSNLEKHLYDNGWLIVPNRYRLDFDWYKLK